MDAPTPTISLKCLYTTFYPPYQTYRGIKMSDIHTGVVWMNDKPSLTSEIEWISKFEVPQRSKVDIDAMCVGNKANKNRLLSRYRIKLREVILLAELVHCDEREFCKGRLKLKISKTEAEPRPLYAFIEDAAIDENSDK